MISLLRRLFGAAEENAPVPKEAAGGCGCGKPGGCRVLDCEVVSVVEVEPVPEPRKTAVRTVASFRRARRERGAARREVDFDVPDGADFAV